ncbi:MAG: ribonuclease P protein component [Treponema sp.]|nr:ribonuclease P protein component [Treponema sp.]
MKPPEPSTGLPGAKFRRREHLKKRDDITRVFKKGRSVTCPGVKLFYLENGLSHNRIAFTFARKYGNAVERNRARRLGREAYRLLKKSAGNGYDLVLLAYPRTTENGGPKKLFLSLRMRQLEILFTKAGLL